MTRTRARLAWNCLSVSSHLPRPFGAASVALMLAIAGLPVTAHAVPLAFSPNCAVHQAVPVVAPHNALLLAKQPAPHPNGTATVFDLINLTNHVIPANSNSCVLAPVPAGGDYCFQARNDATILIAAVGAITDPGGLTPCQ